MYKTVSRVIVGFMIIASAGCAGTLEPVSAKGRDTSGNFDGKWVARHVHTSSTQRVQNWQMTCHKPTDAIALSVVDGQIRSANSKKPQQTYVSNAGRFRMEIPTRLKASESASSEARMDNGKVTVILKGQLSETTGNGKLVFGIAQFGNSGCVSKFAFEKQHA